ncbi:MAG: hypothetical protein AB7S38_32225 [Vulcanimicrobiota bacterium]
MTTFHGRASSLAVPMGGAGFLVLLAVLGLIIITLDGPLAMHGINERVCVLLGVLFALACAGALARVGLKDYYAQVSIGPDGVSARGPLAHLSLGWVEVKRVVEHSLGASLLLKDGSEIDFGPSLAEFEGIGPCLRTHFDNFKKEQNP